MLSDVGESSPGYLLPSISRSIDAYWWMSRYYFTELQGRREILVGGRKTQKVISKVEFDRKGSEGSEKLSHCLGG